MRMPVTPHRHWAAPNRRPHCRPLAGLGAVLVLAALLLLPVAYNGFPLLFSDSGEYYERSVTLQVPDYRTIIYSLWLTAAWPDPHLLTDVVGRLARTRQWEPKPRSLLAGVVAQALLLAALLWQVAHTLLPAASWRNLVGGALLLVVCTAAPWVTSQVMPDVFAPITVLALYLAVTQWTRMTRTGRLVVTFAMIVGVGAHVTHVMIAAALLMAFTVVAARRHGFVRVRDIGRGAGAVAVGVSLLLGINYLDTGVLFLSRNGHVFLLGHLVEAGLAQRLLRDECPNARYALCDFQEALVPDVNWFLWNPNSPFYRLGMWEWEGSKAEASRILIGTLRAYPGAHLVAAVRYTARQLVAIWTLDGLESYIGKPYVDDTLRVQRPDLYPRFRAARQQRGTLHADALATMHQVVASGAALASLWLLGAAWRRRSSVALDARFGFHIMVWVALVCNAALCGNLSGVFDRYQARLVWLLPLAVVVSVEEQHRSGLKPLQRLGRPQ
jgi:hypothetical protein